jgi:hypothetical protein
MLFKAAFDTACACLMLQRVKDMMVADGNKIDGSLRPDEMNFFAHRRRRMRGPGMIQKGSMLFLCESTLEHHR